MILSPRTSGHLYKEISNDLVYYKLKFRNEIYNIAIDIFIIMSNDNLKDDLDEKYLVMSTSNWDLIRWYYLRTGSTWIQDDKNDE